MNCSGIPKSDCLSSAITACRSSFFFPDTRSCSPCTWACTPFTASSPAQAIDAFVPRKSKRCASSFAVWLSALSTSCRFTLLTTSNDGSAIGRLSPPCVLTWHDRTRCPAAPAHPPVRYPAPSDGQRRHPSAAPTPGGLPERPKGAVCKTVGTAYDGSNPSPATTCEDAPRPADTTVWRTAEAAARYPTSSRALPPRDKSHGRMTDQRPAACGPRGSRITGQDAAG